MIITTSIPVLGRDYRELSIKEGKRRWRFVALEDFIYTTDEDLVSEGTTLIFKSDDIPRMKIEQRSITMFTGYAWNGNSPKLFAFEIFGKVFWIGTLDFIPGTVAASGLHDDIFQFSCLPQMPITLYKANDFYYQISTAHGHPMNDSYYLALKNCSGRCWAKPSSGLSCEEIYQNI